MRNKLVILTLFAFIFGAFLCLSAKTTRNERVGRWQMKQLQYGTVHAEAMDTSPIYSEEYRWQNCTILLQRDGYGVRILIYDSEWRRGEVEGYEPGSKIVGLRQNIDVEADGHGWIAVYVEFSEDVDAGKKVVTNYAYDLPETREVVASGRMITLTHHLKNRRGTEYDIFSVKYREAVLELPEKVRAAFFGYAGIK